MFENPEIALDELPDTDALDWERLHPLYARALRIVAAIVLTIMAIAATVLALILKSTARSVCVSVFAACDHGCRRDDLAWYLGPASGLRRA